eukprot:3348648-Rhodomonas_salina.1
MGIQDGKFRVNGTLLSELEEKHAKGGREGGEEGEGKRGGAVEAEEGGEDGGAEGVRLPGPDINVTKLLEDAKKEIDEQT